MAPQKTELKVTINCCRCKSKVLKAVAKLSGVDYVSVDSEKGIVIVIGEVGPVCVTKQIRKTGKVAEIISVGPPKKPDHPPKTPPNPLPKPLLNPPPIEPPTILLPVYCPQCPIILSDDPYDRICTIL